MKANKKLVLALSGLNVLFWIGLFVISAQHQRWGTVVLDLIGILTTSYLFGVNVKRVDW